MSSKERKCQRIFQDSKIAENVDNSMIAAIIAGGEGKRLRPLTADIPKAMIPISGKPVLEHQLAILQRYGITDIYLVTSYLSYIIEDYFRDGKSFGVKITYLCDGALLGTAGAVKELESVIDSDFMLIYGDTLFDVKLDDFINYHRGKNASATLIVHPTDHPYDSDLLDTNDQSRIIKILPKPHGVQYYRNLGNAGMYLLSPAVFSYIPSGGQPDFIKDVFPMMLNQAEKLYAYRTAEYIKDMGTGDRYKKVESDFLSGKVSRRSKGFKRPAIFIDRDGTLIKYVDFLSKPEDLELYDVTIEAISKINQSDYLCILVSNQSVVARNLCDLSTINEIHKRLETSLGKAGVYLDDIFFCPHHPDKGYPEENPIFKRDCKCRKPQIGMIEKARLRYNIDIDKSWVIGDSTTDIQTGVNAGMNTILVRTGNGGRDGNYKVTPDFVFDNLKDGVAFILERKEKMENKRI